MSHIDYQESLARSREGMAFSNGTEGEMWDVNWCARCAIDAPFRAEISPTGCPLLLIAFTGRIPAEWLVQPRERYPSDAYHCIEFRPKGRPPGGEPKPQPTPPGQAALFDRPPASARMLTAGPSLVEERVL